MLSERLMSELNRQINYELYSAYLYTAMETYFLDRGLEGFANFFKVQTMEELAHARILFQYVYRKNGHVALETIDKPEAGFASIIDVFEKALAHEKFVTSRIYMLVDIALEEREHATSSFLKWFVDEQVEEEESFQGLVDRLNLMGDKPSNLFMIDAELGQRAFTLPAPLAPGAPAAPIAPAR